MTKVYHVWVDYDEFKIFSTKEKAEAFNLKTAKKEYESMSNQYRAKYSLKEYMIIKGFRINEVEVE